MTSTIDARAVTGGVDTHLDVHVGAAVDAVGGLLGVAEFGSDRAGLMALVRWLGDFGEIERVGVEGTGSYGAGLAAVMRRGGIEVFEVGRPNRQLRRGKGKSDTIDAIAAARAALSGDMCTPAKSRDGAVEAIRALLVVKRSARRQRVSTLTSCVT